MNPTNTANPTATPSAGATGTANPTNTANPTATPSAGATDTANPTNNAVGPSAEVPSTAAAAYAVTPTAGLSATSDAGSAAGTASAAAPTASADAQVARLDSLNLFGSALAEDKTLEELQAELAIAEAQLEELNASVAEVEEKVAQLEADRGELAAQRDDKQEALDAIAGGDVTSRIEAAQREIDALNVRIAMLDAEIASLDDCSPTTRCRFSCSARPSRSSTPPLRRLRIRTPTRRFS